MAEASNCSPCPAGTFATENSPSCTPCAINTYSGVNAPFCSACATGFTSPVGASVCVDPNTTPPADTSAADEKAAQKKQLNIIVSICAGVILIVVALVVIYCPHPCEKKKTLLAPAHKQEDIGADDEFDEDGNRIGPQSKLEMQNIQQQQQQQAQQQRQKQMQQQDVSVAPAAPRSPVGRGGPPPPRPRGQPRGEMYESMANPMNASAPRRGGGEEDAFGNTSSPKGLMQPRPPMPPQSGGRGFGSSPRGGPRGVPRGPPVPPVRGP